MATQTPKTKTVEMSSSQAQPEIIVNTTTRRLEQLVGIAIVIDSSIATPPTGSPEPQDGDAYIVASSPTGDWTGHHNDIAYLQGVLWKFITPLPGFLAYDQAASGYLKFVAGSWSSASI